MSTAAAPLGRRTGDIPEHVAREVLYHFRDHVNGYESGSFITALLEAMGKADATNFAKLALVYPEYAEAFHLAMPVEGDTK